MIYSKPIAMKLIDNFENRVIKFIKGSGVLDRAKTNSGFYMLPYLITSIPELKNCFEGFRVFDAASYIMFNNQAGKPHKDHTPLKARVNIPILNCENTLTEFWQPQLGEQSEIIQQPNGLPYESYDNCKLDLVHSVCIDQPTVIRVREIHSVRLLSEKIPRITLTLMLYPDPVTLLENEHVDTAN